MILAIQIVLLFGGWFGLSYLLPTRGSFPAAAFLAIPMWTLWNLVSVLAFVIGLPLIAILAALPGYHGTSRMYPDGRSVACFFHEWFSLWENWEDGVDGLPMCYIAPEHLDAHSIFQQQTWGAITPGWSRWRRTFVWSALRNSVNNQRFIWPFRLVIDPSQTRIRYFWRNSAYFVWQGAFSALYVTLGKRYIHVGYKFHQDDAEAAVSYVTSSGHGVIKGVPEHPRTELPDSDARKPGAGFVFDVLKTIDPTSWQTPVKF